jgi:outer membrane biosynthesis protein TonB
MTVQYAIQSALQRDDVIRRNQYNANIMVWLTPAGGVKNSSFLVSTGDPSLDAMIGEAVRKVAIGQSPPYDMPQPVYVRILSVRRKS